jgi:excisionase family DNA binding protein
MLEKQLTAQEVSYRLRVCDETVYRLLKRGELCGYKVGLQWRIDESQLDNFVERSGNNRKGTTAATI